MRNIEEEDFGTLPEGEPIKRFVVRNGNGVTAKLIEYGAILSELWIPDARGNLGNVVLGFDKLEQYLKGCPYFGATTGRYANRIAKGRFSLDGATYSLPINNGPNSLHGGVKGFDKRYWKGDPFQKEGEQGVRFEYTSRDGEEGYPGNLKVTVIYTLLDSDELRIDYTAVTDKATVLNLTNHSYFNLAGGGDILDHIVEIEADHYTPVNDELIPTGEIAPVKGTPLDFTKATPIRERIEQLKPTPGGYDHNFVLRRQGNSLALAARVRDPKSGRVIEAHTTEPGMQLYTGNFLDGKLTGTGGVNYKQHSGFCLETQHFPDSPNQPEFPRTVLRPGETFRSTTVYKFRK